MKTHAKKSFCALLAVALMLCTAPLNGFTEIDLLKLDLTSVLSLRSHAATIVNSGDCGDNVKWELDSEGTLTISGSGDMWNYADMSPSYGFECDRIKSIIVKKGVTSIGFGAFVGYYGLTSVSIPSGVTTIAPMAFEYCPELTSISLPNTITYIGKDAFRDCTKLASITIPAGVTYIGSDAFAGTPWFDTQPDGVVYINNILYCYKGDMPYGTEIIIKSGTISISDFAFCDCTGLTAVTIPSGVRCIGAMAFCGCSELTSITLPNTIESIYAMAFRDCTKLASITIPAGVTSIEYEAFTGTPWFDTQPDGVVYINNILYCYKGDMPYGTEIIIKSGTVGISGFAFAYCDGLTSITIPDSVTYIDAMAFGWCTGLTSVTIPSNVTYIYMGFFQCTELADVIIYPCALCIADAFYGISDDAIIHGYAGSQAEKDAKEMGLTFKSLGKAPQKITVTPVPGVTSKDLGNGNVLVASELTAENAKKMFGDNVTVTPKDKNGKLGTGTVVTLKDSKGNVVDSITLVVFADVDGDAEVSSADARLALRASVGLEKLDTAQQTAAKIESNNITSSDARLILRLSVGLEKTKELMANYGKKK